MIRINGSWKTRKELDEYLKSIHAGIMDLLDGKDLEISISAEADLGRISLLLTEIATLVEVSSVITDRATDID